MAVSDKYSLAVLIIFITLSIPTLFVTFKHGVRGWAILGWGYLFIFCSLKIIGSGMALGDPESSGATIVSSVGLSPLLLALSGVLHEASVFHLSISGLGAKLTLHSTVGSTLPVPLGAAQTTSKTSFSSSCFTYSPCSVSFSSRSACPAS